MPLSLADAGRRTAMREPPGADDSARQAFDAWRGRDYPRLIGLSLVAEGGQGPRTANLADGPGSMFFLRTVPVFVAVQSAAATLTIEAPLARLPQRQRVAAMRVALELCDGQASCRGCACGETSLVARFVGRLGAVTPPMLRQAIREVAAFAERQGEMLEASFDARAPTPDEPRAAVAWNLVGQPRALPRLAPPISQSMPPPPPTSEESAPVSGLESIPAILAPALAGGSSAPAAEPIRARRRCPSSARRAAAPP